MKNLHFLFQFDETTASQIKKKQFDAYATYHSRRFGQTVTGYLGIIFVGRCTNDLYSEQIMDYFEVETFTDLQGRRMMKHVPTRWISLQDVLLRVMEQFNNLRKCFLRILPTEKGFDGKYGIGASD